MFRGRGIHWEPAKDTFTATPAVADGRVFALTTAGWIHALDAATGDPLWEAPLPWAEGAARARAEALERRRLASGSGVQGGSRIVVGDTLVTPDYRDGLMAFDVATGEVRWHRPRSGTSAATPVAWSAGGADFVISPAPNGQVVCVAVATGEEAWRIEDAGTTRYDLAVAGDTLVLHRGSGEDARLAAYRIRPDGFETAWELPADLGGIDGRPVAIHDGVVYAKLTAGTAAIALGDGEVLALHSRRWGSASPLFVAEGRLLDQPDATHSRTEFRMHEADPAGFRVLHELWRPPHGQTSAYYRRIMTHPIVDGRIFLRGGSGIYAYDLRQPGRDE